MASSYSTDLKLELMVTGENAGTWGDITNTNLNLLQQAIGGYQDVSIAGGAQTTTLLMSNAAISNARNAVIKLTGTITGNQIVTVPDGIEKTYIIANGTTGAFTVQFKTATGTGITFATTDKSTKIFFADGTNIVDVGMVSETGVQTLTNKTLTSPKINEILDTNGNEEIKFTTTASAVNEITLANAATGASPTISATGGDTNIGINLTPKGTGGIVLGAGAVATPALTTSGDLNTGIFFPAADTIAFTKGGAEAMRINSSGNVGIGTTSPSSKVEIAGNLLITGANIFTDATSGIFFSGANNNFTNGIGGVGINNIFFQTASAERMRIDSSGKVGIGNTTSGTAFMRVLNTSATERMLEIVQESASSTTDGSIFSYIGTSSGTGFVHYTAQSLTQVVFKVFGNGNVQNLNNSYGSLSDIKIKKDIIDANSQWNDIKNVRVRKFRLKDDPTQFFQIGVVAQELEEVSPNLIEEIPDYKENEVPVLDNNGNPILNEDGTPQTKKEQIQLNTTTKSVKYSVLYMKAIKALQEAMERIEQLETKNISLEARLTALESK